MTATEKIVLEKVNKLISDATPDMAKRLKDIANDVQTISKKSDTRVIRRFTTEDGDDSIPIMKKYYKSGTRELHREDGPAVEYFNGEEHWYQGCPHVKHHMRISALLNEPPLLLQQIA